MPPSYPACIDAAETYRSKAATAACQAALSGYVAAAVTYRTCVQREIESTNLRANSVIDFFKCRSDHHKICPPPVIDSSGPCTSGDCAP